MQQMTVHEVAEYSRDLKQQGTILAVFVLFSEIGVALKPFLAIYLKGFDQEIKDKLQVPKIGTYLMFP